MCKKVIFFIYLIVKFLPSILCWQNSHLNLTNFAIHRQKRFLIYQNNGLIKLVIGPTLPLRFDDPIVFRSVVLTWNLHGGEYRLPTEPLYPFDKWESIFMRSLSDENTKCANIHSDDSRLFVYTALENFMDKQSMDSGLGRRCLLRSICENAQVHQHIGLLSEILDVILTPGNEALSSVYKEAHTAGASGADCLLNFPDCPRGVNFLDEYLDFL